MVDGIHSDSAGLQPPAAGNQFSATPVNYAQVQAHDANESAVELAAAPTLDAGAPSESWRALLIKYSGFALAAGPAAFMIAFGLCGGALMTLALAIKEVPASLFGQPEKPYLDRVLDPVWDGWKLGAWIKEKFL